MPAQPPRRAILHQRQTVTDRLSSEAPEIRSKGTWSSPESDQIDESESITEDIENKQREPAQFVRCVTHVGNFKQGSIVPASTFEYVDNLLRLGAVEYDYTATGTFDTGNPGDMASGIGVLSAAVHNIPNAPWARAAAHNLLGNTYVSVAHTTRSWTPAAPPRDPHQIDDGPTVTIPMGEPNQIQ